ncbi:Glycoside hydrolase/deacetylase [Glarea lozoyensis ATCC 20868]|uniref:Glycoside hydrolase/deacetylase n=1 Tax=Glarea lozoyensis (strain ATCC 20868 / MF5171) TaxID=1116229 RepID=S3DAJ4_GLAL2|nr:Glycoside hydrolase/deacetylase [Glarea lozoyensis ATCC 20868]EPE34144.1 Glycoside hydrolase/deacetylase [Glarea lozoyensis ATCC 20868]
MRSTFFTLATAFTLTSLSVALPAEHDAGYYNFLSRRAVSPDNTCGVVMGQTAGYSCDASANEGGCCSQYGYCGNSSTYCGDGCQSAYGICDAPAPVLPDDDFTCGPLNSNKICSGSLCCSQAGYCGNTTDYCDTGCQSDFGSCTTGADAPENSETCGPNFGNAVCNNNQCCSISGYCGTTEEYCQDPGYCLPGFGRCDSDLTPAGPSTENALRPVKGSVSYTDDIYDCVKDNVVALTYDDGPSEYTSLLLDTLKTYGFKATFFITGNNNGKGAIDTTAPYPDLIKRMIAEGHQVASHTWSHYSLSNITHDLRISQMVKNEMALNNIIGKWPTYMRPPYSDCTQASGCWADLQALGYHRVYFDLDTQDYLNPLPSQIQNSKNIVKQRLADQTATDFLSIQHDIVQQSVANLSSYYFDLIKAKQWTGVTVGECLGDDEANWYRSLDASSSTVAGTSTATSTVKATSTSIKTSVVPTTTKPATVTPKPTTTQAATTAKPTSTKAPTPAPTCAVKAGSWCGTIDEFDDKNSCNSAKKDCLSDFLGCVKTAGIFNLASCTKYNAICLKLTAYCLKCSWGACNNADFGY